MKQMMAKYGDVFYNDRNEPNHINGPIIREDEA